VRSGQHTKTAFIYRFIKQQWCFICGTLMCDRFPFFRIPGLTTSFARRPNTDISRIIYFGIRFPFSKSLHLEILPECHLETQGFAAHPHAIPVPLEPIRRQAAHNQSHLFPLGADRVPGHRLAFTPVFCPRLPFILQSIHPTFCRLSCHTFLANRRCRPTCRF
jgi:hypothetical protein